MSTDIGDFARLSSTITWAVIALTWPPYRSVCHHRQVRRHGLAVASALNGALISLIWWWQFRGGGWFVARCYGQMDGNTDLRNVSKTIEIIVQCLGVALSALSVAYYVTQRVVLLWLYCRGPGRASGTSRKYPTSASTTAKPRRWRRAMVTLCGVIWMVMVFTLMCLALATFVIKKTLAARAAGPSLEENEWGFGQIMAVTVWFPTILDFLLVIRGKTSLQLETLDGVCAD